MVQSESDKQAERAGAAGETAENTDALSGNDELRKVQQERDELKDRMLRVAADYQNYVRRTDQSVSQGKQQQVFDMARELLNVVDHFDQALTASGPEAAGSSLLKGLQMVRDEFIKTMGKFGVQPINVQVGDAFDPTHHEALMRQKVEGMEADHVAALLLPGYMLHNRVLRPAKVSVSGD